MGLNVRQPPPNNKPCPVCDSLDTEKTTEEVEYGSPLNMNTTGLATPRYRTKTVSYHYCNQCGWNEKYNPNPKP